MDDPIIQRVVDEGDRFTVVYFRTPGGNNASVTIDRAKLWTVDMYETLRTAGENFDRTARALDARRGRTDQEET